MANDVITYYLFKNLHVNFLNYCFNIKDTSVTMNLEVFSIFFSTFLSEILANNYATFEKPLVLPQGPWPQS